MLTPLGFSLLRELADGEFHSGEDLADKVGLTRARVSQVLKDAEAAGLALERMKGRGYRLLEAPDFLDGKAVALATPDARRNASGRVADGDRGRRSDRIDIVRAHAPDPAPRRSPGGPRGRMADGGSRAPRARVDGDRGRQPHVLPRLEIRAGRGVPGRAFAGGRRRGRARARGRGIQGHRAQVAERSHPPAPEARRDPHRTERRRARSDDHGDRGRAQRAPAAGGAPATSPSR